MRKVLFALPFLFVLVAVAPAAYAVESPSVPATLVATPQALDFLATTQVGMGTDLPLWLQVDAESGGLSSAVANNCFPLCKQCENGGGKCCQPDATHSNCRCVSLGTSC
ncbi:MAG TPA: hypothetical protein VMM92_02445 [Thermoanaerobaculia bacterium]|nr:hypothetical protein [Thermoanaerobaculia bacterium]